MSTLDPPTIDQLIAIIELQAAAIHSLEARVNELEAENARLRKLIQGQGPPSSVNTSKPPALSELPHFVKPNRLKPKDKKQRRQRDVGYSRPLGQPTRMEEHAVDACPDCGRRLSGGWLHAEREVIDIPAVSVEVIHHRFMGRRCGVCRKRHLPKRAEALWGVAVGRHRFGVRLISLIAELVNVCRLPVRTVKRLLFSLFGVRVSEGGIVALLSAVARAGARVYGELQEAVRGSPFVHADETGWREDGMNGYLWSFSTPNVRLFVRRPSRGHEVPESVLGSAYRGTVVSDFYSAYSYHLGSHQRCWVHLLRDLKKLQETFADEPSVQEWADEVYHLYVDATSVCHLRRKDRVRARERFQDRAVALALSYRKTDRPQALLAQRLYRFASELFTFVEHPEIPPDNNAAERAIRPAVIARKISGGTRSEQGSEVRTTLMSLFGTWTLRGLDPLHACQLMLTENR
jgi:transposase